MIADTTRRAITDPEAVVTELQRENDALMAHIASLEARTLSSEELAYLRNRKLADERASWAWQWLHTNVPIAVAICSAVGAFAYWAITSLTFRHTP